MKNYIVLAICAFVTVTVSAQKGELTGNWIETYQIYLDTLDSGIEVFMSDPDAYRNGTKTIPKEHIRVVNLYEVFDGRNADRKRKLEITKEKDYLRATIKDEINEKMIYNNKVKNYVVTFPTYVTLQSINNDMIVRYNEKTKNLQFVQYTSPKEETIVYEFVRIE